MSRISTHVLDTAKGAPASGILVALKRAAPDRRTWDSVGSAITDENGRIASVLDASETLQEGTYQLIFHVGDYFEAREHFYPEIAVQFRVNDPSAHYHVPLLLSPYGYTTYRGS
jgi:5-hydroxyisourate hydrolase